MSTSDAVSREAAWLNTTSDSLPHLPATAGGPWSIVQGYWPATRLATQKTGIYLLRTDIDYQHVSAMRYRPQYEFSLRLIWPVKASTAPLAEQEQQAFDNAIDLLLQRIAGPLGDKTHGGRFLSVAEVPAQNPVMVRFDDPEHTIPAAKELRAVVAYRADDLEFND